LSGGGRSAGALTSRGGETAADGAPGERALEDGAGLYLHVPFCSAVCPYCDFAVTVGGEPSRRSYLSALAAEIALWAGGEDAWRLPFDTVYLGGGTPSWLRPDELAGVFAALEADLGTAGAWIQLEANPEDVSAGSLAAWRRLGVATLSLGVQSFDDRALVFLGRRHRAAEGRRAVELALAAGFESVSLDLIYGLPGASVEELARDLEAAVALAPHHLSCYQLTVEPGTVFGHRRDQGELAELPEPRQAALFRFVHRYLADAGYPAYEVSNFARAPGHCSRHNRKYWRHVPYLGLGPSAHSYDGGRRRWWNLRGLAAWRRAVERGERPLAGAERLGDGELALEALMLGLRTADGIDLALYRRRYGVDLLATDGALVAGLVEGGRALVEDGRLRLTLDGLVVAEGLAARFALAA